PDPLPLPDALPICSVHQRTPGCPFRHLIDGGQDGAHAAIDRLVGQQQGVPAGSGAQVVPHRLLVRADAGAFDPHRLGDVQEVDQVVAYLRRTALAGQALQRIVRGGQHGADRFGRLDRRQEVHLHVPEARGRDGHVAAATDTQAGDVDLAERGGRDGAGKLEGERAIRRDRPERYGALRTGVEVAAPSGDSALGAGRVHDDAAQRQRTLREAGRRQEQDRERQRRAPDKRLTQASRRRHLLSQPGYRELHVNPLLRRTRVPARRGRDADLRAKYSLATTRLGAMPAPSRPDPSPAATAPEVPPAADIPMLDLAAEVEELWHEIQPAVERVLKSGAFIGGREVEAFEEEVASYLGVRHAVGLNSGTDALVLGLEALGIGPGDEVVTS